MTCYFRQLQEVFKKAGITVTTENKYEVDKIIHSIVGIEYKNCPPRGKRSRNASQKMSKPSLHGSRLNGRNTSNNQLTPSSRLNYCIA